MFSSIDLLFQFHALIFRFVHVQVPKSWYYRSAAEECEEAENRDSPLLRWDEICGIESTCATCQLEQVKNKLAESQAVSVMPSNQTVASFQWLPSEQLCSFLGVQFPFVTSRGSKLNGLSLTFRHGWILDSLHMGDATCYSQSCRCVQGFLSFVQQ